MDRSTTSRQLARRIRLLRMRRGWSAQQLADACASAGAGSLTRATIAKIESGTRQSVTADEVAALAGVLGTPATELLGPESPAEAFFGALLDLSRQAGSPPIRELARKLEFPGSALSDVFRGRSIPDWPTLEPVVRALGGDPDRFRELREQALRQRESPDGDPEFEKDFPWLERLEGIANREAHANPRQRNSFALTERFLEVGLAMADEDMGEESGPAFGWRQISRERVVRSAAKAAEQDPDWSGMKPSLGAFRDRWPVMGDYLRDLVAYSFYSTRWREALEFARTELLNGLDDVAKGKTRFSNLILAVAKKDMALRLRFARYLIFQLTLTVDRVYSAVAQEAHARFFEAYSQSWVDAYDEALKKLGLTLRPGVTVEELAMLFGCLAYGITMIATEVGDDQFTKDENDRPLLAEGVMLMILGAIETGDDRSSGAGVDALIGS